MTASIPDPVQQAAQAQPDTLAVVAPDEAVSYGELERRVAAYAAYLRACDLAPGDRMAIYQPPSVDYLVALLASFRAGIVACPLNTRLPADAVPAYLRQIDCHVLAADPDSAWTRFRLLEIGTLDRNRGATENDLWALDAPATLVFTSGSTGAPKAALHTLGNHVWSARGLASTIPLESGNRWLLDLPLYHVGGLAILFRCMLAGATVILPGKKSTAHVIDEVGVTHASFVATQLLRIMQHDASVLSRLKAILLGGSAIPPGLIAAAVEAKLPVHTSYGMTEMTSTVTATPSQAALHTLGTSGAVLPHREVRLAEDGEVLVRGATLFAGYVEGDTVERLDAGGGWFPTGDLGAWTESAGQQMLQIIGRKDHLFISGGENVQPEEIEAALGRLPGIRRATVVAVPDAEFGQRPVAFVEAERWAPAAWAEALGGTLAKFKVPAAFYSWPEDLDTGLKVSRRALQDRVASENG